MSTLQVQDGVQYRVLGEPAPRWHAAPAEPTLEDGYMGLMHEARG